MEEACVSDFSPRQDSPFCHESILSYAFAKKRCEFWVAQQAEVEDGNGIALTTRARMFNASKLCVDREADCLDNRMWNYTLVKDIYLMDVQRFWIWIEHAMVSGKPGLKASSENLDGRFWFTDPALGRYKGKYKELEGLPDDFGTPPHTASEQPSLQPAASSALAIGRNSSTPASLLESKALAKRAKSSIVRSEVSAKGSQSFLAQSRIRSRRVARRHGASSANRVNALRAVGSTKGKSFVLSQPYKDTKHLNDVIPLEWLLKLAKADLDAPFKTGTHRMHGLTLTVRILYTNGQVDWLDFVGLRIFPWSIPLQSRFPWDPEGFTRARYDIWAYSSPQGYETKSSEDYRSFSASYILWKKHGIYIGVVQSGQMLIWSWSKMAIYVSTAVGLISVAFRLTRFWAYQQKPLKNLMVERYASRGDSGEYERICSYDDPDESVHSEA
eukprot:TRINITY_DN13389_c0_g2_i1.p1 TRINITY_DN13389_c0_g2~~TRINITY_DN13389_c0_g2_i1.p1  ORF type:complete len:454 (+),score=11.07 TRINITY_DN13389_c0_g2_i1:36-1364(+)